MVDLKSDGQKEWLTSRLYLFSNMLSRMKSVRCIVFTATRGDVGRCFLGVAGAEELLHALAAAQPWLRLDQLQAESNQVGKLQEEYLPPAPAWFSGDIDGWWQLVRADPYTASPLSVARKFLERVQGVQPSGTVGAETDWL